MQRLHASPFARIIRRMVRFADRLTRLLAALSFSRGRLGGRDGREQIAGRSLVFGHHQPFSLYLDRLTIFVAARCPGLHHAQQAGGSARARRSLRRGTATPACRRQPAGLGLAVTDIALRGADQHPDERRGVRGIWRTTRPSADTPGMFARRGAGGSGVVLACHLRSGASDRATRAFRHRLSASMKASHLAPIACAVNLGIK